MEHNEQRPKRNDPAILDAAVRKIAEACAEWAGDDSAPEEWYGDLRKAMRWSSSNGYELARELEHSGVSPDLELVEILDGASGAVWTAHDAAVKAWVQRVGFTPAFKVGDRVCTPRGNGPVWRIDEAKAQYIVSIDGQSYGGGGGAVIDAELVTAEEVPA